VTDCSESYVMDVQFYRIRRLIDDSTTKNTRLLDREFNPKAEHLEMQFGPPNYLIPANLTNLCHCCYSYSVGRLPAYFIGYLIRCVVKFSELTHHRPDRTENAH